MQPIIVFLFVYVFALQIMFSRHLITQSLKITFSNYTNILIFPFPYASLETLSHPHPFNDSVLLH